MKRARIFDVPLDLLTVSESVDRCVALIEQHRFAQHVVINAWKVVLMRDDAEIRGSVQAADVVNADGQSIVWAGRFLGVPVPERVTGIDLMEHLLAQAERRRFPVFFLGAKPHVLEVFRKQALGRYPDLVVAGVHHGYFDDDVSMADLIRGSGARLLFVAMPSPRKERFVDGQRDRLGPLLAMGVGGSFDVWAGVSKRAPRWMQRTGLEWLYRFAQEPRRMWRRYLLGNLRFALIVLQERLSRKAAGSR